MKTCSKCGAEKALEAFPKGKGARCKACKAEYGRRRYIENVGEVTARHRKYNAENVEKLAEYRRAYNLRTREQRIEKQRKNRAENSEKIAARARELYHDFRVKHPEKVLEKQRKYRAKNPAACAASVRRYQAGKLNRTPAWLTEEHHAQIAAIYAHAKDCELTTGEAYHVDHIIPLQGKTMSGLHVPWNLQVLPADVNIGKSNRYIAPEAW